MAPHCDLIMVFMDPIGGGLCSRTMNVVESLNEQADAAQRTKYVSQFVTCYSSVFLKVHYLSNRYSIKDVSILFRSADTYSL